MKIIQDGSRIIKNANSVVIENAIALLHFDSDFSDSRGHTVNISGSPTINTTNKKFGGGSVSFSGSNYLQIIGTDMIFTGDFTIETWIRYTSFPPSKRCIINTCLTQKTGAWGININESGTINLDQYNFGNWINGSINLVDSNWHHIAFTRNSGTIRLFIDGVLQGIFSNSNVVGTNEGITLAARGNVGGENITASLDETMITNIGKYTSNFTPPIIAYN